MTAAPHPDLAAALAVVRIRSPTGYTFAGEERQFPPPADPAADPPFLAALEQELYARVYTRPTPTPPPADFLAQRDHLAALSAANTGGGSWEPGWQVVGLEPDGRVAVRKDEVTFWVTPDGLRARAGPPAVGGYCRVRVAKEMRSLMPGFYCAIGDGDQHDAGDAPAPLVRYYWHLTARGAAAYMAAATAVLNRRAVPFRTKVLSDPNGYGRADAGVLYLERRHADRLGTALVDIHRAVAAELRPEVPLFTRPLAPGLGVAEDPGGGQSFGQHRCRLVARAAWAAFAAEADPLGVLADHFQAAGLDPARPHLDPGARDAYALTPPGRKAAAKARAKARGRRV